MHVKRFLHKLLAPVIHISRVNTLSEAVHAAIITKDLTLTGLGRAIDLPIQERSGIQKMNRLLGNKKLLADYKCIVKAVSGLLIGKIVHPEIIIDWSKYPNSSDAIIRAALATDGRALTLYEE